MIACAVYAARRAGMMLWRMLLIPPLFVVSQTIYINANDVADPWSNWFRPISITIPDFCEGADPVITQERWVARDFIGSYRTEYEDLTRNARPLLPYDSPEFLYRKRQDVVVPWLLSEFMGRKPDLKPGRYVARVTWTMHRPWHTTTVIDRQSNPFEVWPRDDDKCQPVITRGPM